MNGGRNESRYAGPLISNHLSFPSMAALYSSTTPQLPPFRHLAFYPSHVATQLPPNVVTSTPPPRPLPSAPDKPQPQLPAPIRLSSPYRPVSLSSSSSSFFPQQPQSRLPPESRTRVLSSFMPRSPRSSSLLNALQLPSILAALLVHLDWPDVYPLFTTCRSTRDLFRSIPLRDVVLARYVPGYAHALRARDMIHYHDVPVSLHDLDLLLISQRAPLHRYPTHALCTLSSLFPTFEDDETTAKLVALAQAHSRFVLLLQSLVHSSSMPFPLEPEELKVKSRFPQVQTLRELTFPAPLAYTQLPSPPGTPPRTSTSTSSSTRLTRHKHSKSQPNDSDTSREFALHAHTPSAPMPKKGRRLSIFGKKPSLTPPPPEEPKTLKASTWRRKHASVDERAHIDEFGSLRRPTRRFASADASSDSSLNSASPSIAGRDSPASPIPVPASSPHDLIFATSRIRAPILRVFVPCAKLEEDSLAMCERQLEESGLWEHLSTGDIVCNLGYVPPSPEEGSSDGDDPTPVSLDNHNSNYNLRPRASQSFQRPPSTSQRKWLLFDGDMLIPYSPPDLLPLAHPLNLPSPFYYAHLAPPHANLLFSISRLPVCDDVPQLLLINAASRVPSPHSPKGAAVVKRYAWTARVVRLKGMGPEDADMDVGEGWFGEWVLEGEGTQEGKRLLLDALAGRPLGRRVWELVREKSGGGKIWLRLLPL
ncbi:hypothetical protein GALMADRAFT_94242 [Galerina marginata CBS 339.88]|uniref:Uncharacterized protein n=1 Tax=Galerina marginata (strain CBS 339.88) TaxID=685588 RepID=A0A067T9I8_GALM3|nr:hypothetical protein GALMADRAFT_94242 [Galerina marginata CBS 339.88]